MSVTWLAALAVTTVAIGASPAAAGEPTPAEPTPAEPTPIRVETATPPCPPRFSISLGGGPGIPLGDSAERFDVGLHAAVDFRWFPDPSWALWVQTTLSLLPLTDGLPVEPGAGSGISAFTFVAGAEWRLALTPALDAAFALGVGLGGFGLRATDEAMGWAIDASAGARYALDENLALRLDFAPVIVIPLDAEQKSGGHLAIVLRGEARF